MKTSPSQLRLTRSTTFGPMICLALVAVVALSLAHAQSSTAMPIGSMEARSAFATGIENQLRQAGKDARVQLDGDQRDVLRIDWQRLNRRDLNAFFNSEIVQSQAEQVGLRTIVVTGGTQRWDYDLARQSLVWSPFQP